METSPLNCVRAVYVYMHVDIRSEEQLAEALDNICTPAIYNWTKTSRSL